MKTIETRIAFCQGCSTYRTFIREGEKMNWVMHIALIVVTAGAWVPVIFLMAIWKFLARGGAGNDWVCGTCGRKLP